MPRPGQACILRHDGLVTVIVCVDADPVTYHGEWLDASVTVTTLGQDSQRENQYAA